MNHRCAVLCIICLYAMSGFAAKISNIQFSDMSGKSYNLYSLLSQGKFVYLMTEQSA